MLSPAHHPNYAEFQRLTILHSPNINQIALTPDGKMIVGRDADGKTVRFWDAETGALLRTLTAHESVKQVSLSKHGQTLMSLRNDGIISLWDLVSNRRIGKIDTQDSEVSDWALSRNNRWLAVCHYERVKVWNTQTGEVIQQFSLTPDRTKPYLEEEKRKLPFFCYDLAIREDGKMVAATLFGNVTLWFLETGRVHPFIADKLNKFRYLWFSPDGILLVGSHMERTQLRVWRLYDGNRIFLRHESGCYRPMHSADISQDSRILVFAEQTNLENGFFVQAIDLTTIQAICKPLAGHQAPISDIATNADGSLAVTCGGQKHPKDKECDRTIRLWNLKTGQCLRVISGCFEPKFLAVAADNQTLVAANRRGASFWDLRTGEWTGEAAEYPWDYVAFTLSADRQKVLCCNKGVAGVMWSESSDSVIGGKSDVVEIWDLTTKKRLRKCFTLLSSTGQVALSYDEDYLFLTFGNGVRVADRRGELHLRLEGHQANVTALAPCPDYQTLISGDKDGEICLWNYQTGECIGKLQGHGAEVRSLLVTSDQDHLISASQDGCLYIWNLKTGEIERSIPSHSSDVHSLAWTQNEQVLMSSGTDGTIQLWNWRNSEHLHTFSSEGQPSYTSTISPDGRFIIQALTDELVILGISAT